jgi:hypothetical protein
MRLFSWAYKLAILKQLSLYSRNKQWEPVFSDEKESYKYGKEKDLNSEALNRN